MRAEAPRLPDHPARLHLVGVAGSGMQPLALLLAEAGHRVSGSDRTESPRLAALRSLGVDARAGHHPDLAAEAVQVIASPSIPADDPELRAARRAGLPILHRAEALSLLVAGRESICVSGSHGKTTTTALLAHLLTLAGRDPGFMVGGSAASLGGRPGRLGRRDAPFVMEACEAFGALAAWRPAHVLLTCIDDEHNEDYGGQDGLMQAFAAYLGRLPPGGIIVGCGDDAGVCALLAMTARPALTYGLGPGNRLRAVPDDSGKGAAIWLDGERLGALSLPLPGRHMLRNILGAVGMALGQGLPWPAIAEGVARFTGVERRMQLVGSVSGIRVFDDFAHHPAEAAATLQALAPRDGRLVVVLEAQRPHRMERLAGRFAQALKAADLVLLMAVDGACRAFGNAGQLRLAEALSDQGIAFRNLDSIQDLAATPWRAQDTVVVMAHGGSSALAGAVLSALPAQPVPRDALSVRLGADAPRPTGGWDGAGVTWLDLFDRQKAGRAAALAAEDAEAALSYADLAARGGAVAALLRRAGIGRGEIVAVCLGRGVARAVAFLGVLRAGAVYLPLDPDLPAARLALLAEDAQLRCALTDPATRPVMEGLGLTCHDVAALPPAEGPAGGPSGAEPIRPDEPAYLIHTSGSTGEPKGVLIPHGALARYAQAAGERFGVHERARIAPLTSFGFDISIGDMAMALARGAAVVFPSAAQARIGPPLARFLVAARVTHITHTPSALRLMPPMPEGAALSHVISMGEPCPPDLVARWAPGRCLINAYGPTEATILSTSAVCTPGEPVHVGTPFAGEGVCILDDRLEPVLIGEPGEICILGAGLALRYHRRPFLTEDRYPTVDLGPYGRHRVYRTGDLGRLRPDGTLTCEGRLDDQIKFRGFRVEPAEIEAALRRQAGVEDAYVRLHRAAGRPDRLVAYAVGPTAATLAGRAILTSALARQLPPHMVPGVIVPVPEIPMNANGKRIASAMPPPPEPDPHPAPTLDQPFTPTQRRLVALYRDVLGLDRPIGTRETFASLGVDSLQTATLYLAIEEAFGVMLTLDLARDAETIELLALHLDAAAGPRSPPPGAAARDAIEALVQSQRGYLAAWKGRRVGPRGLLSRFDEPGADDAPPLFWCFQGSAEHQELARQLGEAQPVVAMRSGYLIMDYTDENLAALAACYADEVMAVQPAGPLRLGGNCQGGLVMHRVALELISRGRDVALLILMEVGQFPAYPGRVALLFGSDSHFNPYLSLADPARVFDLAYPGGYEVRMVPGKHGRFFRPPFSAPLAGRIASLLGADHPPPADAV